MYVILTSLTDLGIQDIKEIPARIDAAAKTLKAEGSKLVGFYAVMGHYDYVAIVEAPSDGIILSEVLKLTSVGGLRTTTLKAFTREEFAEKVKNLSQIRLFV